MPDPLVESKTLEAANAAAVANEAQHRATSAQTEQIVKDTLEGFFTQQTEKERFIATSRVPFICFDISGIKISMQEVVKLQQENQKELLKAQQEFEGRLEEKLDNKYITKERFKPVETLIYGFIALSLTILIGAIITNNLGVHLIK